MPATAPARPTPILFLSDSPDQCTGLARITRDLASLLVRSPAWRVGVMGRGGWGSRKLPFAQYSFGQEWGWGTGLFPRIWNDFGGEETGVVFTVWDAGRLGWLGMPKYNEDPAIRELLETGRVKRWAYVPVDSPGVRGLTGYNRDTLAGFDRVLAYTKFGAGELNREFTAVDWMPHGIDLKLWKRSEDVVVRETLFGGGHGPVIGCVMTNQRRKDWGLAFETASRLRDTHWPDLRLWAHVDVPDRHWDVRALIADYGAGGWAVVTDWMPDRDLAKYYSACDLTILPSLGEGFGYPIAEALACGTPCIHGNWAGGAELLPEKWLVEPCATRISPAGNLLRPVYHPDDWVKVCDRAVRRDRMIDGVRDEVAAECRSLVEHLDWPKLWPVWEKWFDKGLEELQS